MWDIEEVREAFNGRLMGSLDMRLAVCEAVLLLPSETIEHVTANVWFISSPDDSWAFTFRGLDVENQHLIFLSSELFEEDRQTVQYTILHEIGHVLLNHRNSMGFAQAQSEIKKQEEEADQFARQYLG